MNTGSLNEVFVLKTVAKWTHFAYTTQIDTHTRINTGACRSAKTSKLVCYKITITRPHLITKHPLAKNKPWKKLSTTLLDTKTQNHFVEKRERTSPPTEISCGADNSGAELRGTQKTTLLELWTSWVVNFAILTREFYFYDFNRQMWKKDNKICDLTILNFILFFQKSEPLYRLICNGDF